MRESKFNQELIRSLQARNCWAYKIPDIPFARGDFHGKPCDIVLAYEGVFAGIESKQIKRWQGMRLVKILRPSQIEHLEDMIAKGNQAFVAINVRIKPDSRKKRPREDRCIIIPYKVFKKKLVYSISELKQLEHVNGVKGDYGLNGFLDNLKNQHLENLF